MRSVHNRSGGFTLLEIMVVVAIIGFVALMGLPALQNFILRAKHEGAARQISMLMHRAKMEAVQQSVPTVVSVDLANETVTAFADINEDGDFAFNPLAGADYKTTDYQIGGTYKLPAGVDFLAPGAEAVVYQLSDVTWNTVNVAVFGSDGSVDETGAFRTGDLEGNFLEVAIEPKATAKIQIRKWDGANFLAQGEGGKTWKW